MEARAARLTAPGDAVTPDGQSVRVLVVEDDALVAFDLEVLLKAAGYSVVGPVGRLEEAVAMASEGLFDVALLDIHLRGEEVYPVADILTGRGIPFMFLSGYGEGDLPARPAMPAMPAMSVPPAVTPIPNLHHVAGAAGARDGTGRDHTGVPGRSAGRTGSQRSRGGER